VSDSVPAHQTTVDPFQIEVVEVSLDQYVAFLNERGPRSHLTGCDGNPCALTTTEDANSFIAFNGTTYALTLPESGSYPASFVTWWGAQSYCAAIDRRLPTEAEWEHAARGPNLTIYPWGNTFDVTLASSSQSQVPGVAPVLSNLNGASGFGVFNMAGNVQEWVADWYQADYYTIQTNDPTPNPTGPASGGEKVLRGGSWDTGPLFLRTVHRRSATPDTTSAAIGFRCVSEDTSDIGPVGGATRTPTPAATDTPEG
jgi:iron(II)-dependent oxidoreductase